MFVLDYIGFASVLGACMGLPFAWQYMSRLEARYFGGPEVE